MFRKLFTRRSCAAHGWAPACETPALAPLPASGLRNIRPHCECSAQAVTARVALNVNHNTTEAPGSCVRRRFYRRPGPALWPRGGGRAGGHWQRRMKRTRFVLGKHTLCGFPAGKFFGNGKGCWLLIHGELRFRQSQKLKNKEVFEMHLEEY